MQSGISLLCSAAVVVAVTALAGCYESLEPAPAAQSPAPAQPATPQAGTWQQGSHSGSALGGARRSAQGVAGDLQDRSQDIADDIDQNRYDD